MIFMPRQKKKQRPDMSININNNKIERVKETVFLGVVLDENLSWKCRDNLQVKRLSPN